MKRLLIIDDEKDITLLLGKFFTKKGFETFEASTGEEGIAILKKQPVDIALCDFRLPDYDGLEILQKIKIISPDTKVIIITGYSDVRIAVQALKRGAADYVTKPLFPDEILATVEAALKKGDDQHPIVKTARKRPSSTDKSFFIQGESEQSRAVQRHIELIAPTNMSVVIQGETGTGKEYAARSIHQQSLRSSQPFVAVDCGALPKDLAGSELFGHEKGAFTGATQDRKGCFEVADGGTLFLDEIGNLSYDDQVKLLRVIQERVVRRIGSSKELRVDVRLIVATNEDLLQQAKKGVFREDLYYRLNEFKIQLSPLRERKPDIQRFTQHFIEQSNQQLGKAVSGLDKQAEDILTTYYWPGNLRELKNVIKRSTLLTKGDKITADTIPMEIRTPASGESEVYDLDGAHLPSDLKSVVELAEKQAVQNALNRSNGNKSLAAKILGVDRKTLYNKINAYNIDSD